MLSRRRVTKLDVVSTTTRVKSRSLNDEAHTRRFAAAIRRSSIPKGSDARSLLLNVSTGALSPDVSSADEEVVTGVGGTKCQQVMNVRHLGQAALDRPLVDVSQNFYLPSSQRTPSPFVSR